MREKGSLFLLLTSFLLYGFDVGSDIYVAITYFQKEDYWWFGMTIALVILSGIIVNIFALYGNFHISDEGMIFKVLAFVFQLSVIQQYWEALKRWKRMNIGATQPCNEDNYDTCECENCKHYLEEKKKCAKYDNDLALTRYIEAFVESAPQWCLQFYIMLRQWSFPWITVTSNVISLLSLAWSITLVGKIGKIKRNPTMPFPKRSLIVLALWRLCTLVSRLSAIVIFAYAYRSYVFIVIGIHWTAATMLGLFNSEDRCLSLVMCFFFGYSSLFHLPPFFENLVDSDCDSDSDNDSDSDSQWIMIVVNIVYCSILFLENIIMVSFSVWYEPTSTPHIELLEKIVLPLMFGGFAIGLLFCVLYYKFFYPRKISSI